MMIKEGGGVLWEIPECVEISIVFKVTVENYCRSHS